MPQIPRILLEIRDYLASCGMVMESAKDGRRASDSSEGKIIQKIAECFDIQTPPDDDTRHWWDFAVAATDAFYPVNLKVSKFGGASDNLNCKCGIYYALTGRTPDFHNEIKWNTFFRRLKADMRDNDKDYYFLVVNKRNTSDILVQGLKTIRTLTPNGSNPPFQCCWRDNQQLQSRSFAEARDFLLSHLARSAELRANIYFEFQEHFPGYPKE